MNISELRKKLGLLPEASEEMNFTPLKKVTDLSAKDARSFFLKSESYVNFELPIYFKFQNLLDRLSDELDGKQISGFQSCPPRKYEDINYKLLYNKNGKYAWRPYELIHPAIYVSLVNLITQENAWAEITERFLLFSSNDKIQCHSIPVMSESARKGDKDARIHNWWEMIEQRSIALALDYQYMLQTDITDCYGSIYTHSIPWAIHGRKKAKEEKNRRKKSLIGVAIDSHLQDMRYGQTNGIPQGSVLMDFIAEMVLGYVDLNLTEKIEQIGISDYYILRYRDDYRIFSNNTFEAEVITKALSETLTEIGLKLNAEKTNGSNDVITNSIKPDKRYWIANKRIAETKQKWLIQLHLLSESFPNSGTLEKQMKDFLKVMQKSKKRDPNITTLISLVVDIAYRNPRVAPAAVNILSFLINQLDQEAEKLSILRQIKAKFDRLPNSGLLKVWLQRLFLKLDDSITYDERLCQKVVFPSTKIWNNEWLDNGIQKIFEEISIVNNMAVEDLKPVVTKKEINLLLLRNNY